MKIHSTVLKQLHEDRQMERYGTYKELFCTTSCKCA
jgi:hypothetical protein